MSSLAKIIAAHPLQSEKPYNRVKFARFDQNRTPVYKVGNGKILRNAENALREAANRFGWGCFYCGKQWQKGASSECTIDHVRAISKKGEGDLHNLVLACKSCNREKGQLDLVAFRPDTTPRFLDALNAHLTRSLKQIRTS